MRGAREASEVVGPALVERARRRLVRAENETKKGAANRQPAN